MNYYRKIDKSKIQFDFLCNSKIVAYEDEIIKLGGKIYKITARSKNYKKYKEELKKFYEDHAKEYTTIWVNICSLANIDYLKMARRYGIKYRIIHSHNSENMDSKLREILHKINKIFISHYATDFWACSKKSGKWFYSKRIMNNEKYKIINNAVDVKKYRFNNEIRRKCREELGISSNFVIGNVGRLHFQKNQEFLIDIFNEISKREKSAKLLLVGQGEDEEKLKEKSKMLGLENKIMFLGLRKDINNILQAMDVFVFPSKFEGLPVSLIEAQISGLQIYASSEVIPSEIKMSERFNFVSLDKLPEEWATIILDKKCVKRSSNEEAIMNIKKNGYDIEIETEKVVKYFERK